MKREIRNFALFISFVVASYFSAASSLSAYVVISNGGKPAYWSNSSDVQYQFYNVPEEFKNAIESSFLSWTNVDDVNISFSESGSGAPPQSRDGVNSIVWTKVGWTDLSFRPPSRALAVTLSSFNSSDGTIVDGDIYFNDENFTWANVNGSADSSKIDVQNIATHEIGHLIGLDHSSVSFLESDEELLGATMYYASGAGETARRVPQTDDEKGVRNLYPASARSVARINSIQVLENSGTSALIRVSGENFSDETSFILTRGDTSTYDSVSRYRTYISSSEYELQFNLSNYSSGDSRVVAFNSPTQLAVSSVVNIESSGSVSATSSGGGGGCALSNDVHSTSSSSSLFIFVLLCLAIALRQTKKQLVQ